MRAEDYRIPYRIVLGIFFGNFGKENYRAEIVLELIR